MHLRPRTRRESAREELLGPGHPLSVPVKLGAAVAGPTLSLASLAGTAAYSLARQVVTLPSRAKDPVRVHELQPFDERAGLITLDRVVETDAAGEYTITWRSGLGRARLLEVISTTARTVTRRYADAHGVPLAGVRAVRVASAPQLDITDLELPWREVHVPGERGEAAAWFVPARDDSHDWAIHVHGRGATLTEPLRAVPIAHAHGWHSLVVRYRNDPDAPRGHRGKSGLGLTEWHDVDAAIEYALARGARRIILVGWSMGGAISVQTALRSEFADRIVGLMLESPALDWRETLTAQAAQMRVPTPVAHLGLWLLGSPLARPLLGAEGRIDLDALDVVARAAELRWPILLLASIDDTVVPVGGSQRLAAARPELVEYVEFTRARHTRLWNTDRTRWETAVADWFARFDR